MILIEPISSYRFMLSVFGRALDDLDDERFIAAWIDTALAVANKHGLSSGA